MIVRAAIRAVRCHRHELRKWPARCRRRDRAWWRVVDVQRVVQPPPPQTDIRSPKSEPGDLLFNRHVILVQDTVVSGGRQRDYALTGHRRQGQIGWERVRKNE